MENFLLTDPNCWLQHCKIQVQTCIMQSEISAFSNSINSSERYGMFKGSSYSQTIGIISKQDCINQNKNIACSPCPSGKLQENQSGKIKKTKLAKNTNISVDRLQQFHQFALVLTSKNFQMQLISDTYESSSMRSGGKMSYQCQFTFVL